MKQKRADHDAKLSAKRDEAAEHREAQFAGMEDKATTTAQKAAVAAFKTAVNSAITTRKAAVDAAISTFRSGVDGAITTRKAAIQTTRTTFKAAIEKAIEQAKADCAAGKDGKVVHETMRASIAAAQAKFVAYIKAIEKPKVDRESLITARKAAIDKAMADFKAAMDKARADLKKALGEGATGEDKDTATSTGAN